MNATGPLGFRGPKRLTNCNCLCCHCVFEPILLIYTFASFSCLLVLAKCSTLHYYCFRILINNIHILLINIKVNINNIYVCIYIYIYSLILTLILINNIYIHGAITHLTFVYEISKTIFKCNHQSPKNMFTQSSNMSHENGWNFFLY